MPMSQPPGAAPGRPVRVLELVSGLATEATSGGVARFVSELVNALDRGRVQPFVAALWDYETPFEQSRAQALADAGIPTILAAPWDEQHPYRSCAAGLRGLWRELPWRVDLIHSHGEFSDLAAIALQRKLGARRLLRTVHNEREWSKRPMWGKLFPNLIYPWFFRTDLAVSQRAAANLRGRPLARLLGQPATCIPNALDFDRVARVRVNRELKRKSLDVPADAFVIGSIGRLSRQKGYDVLLDAAPAVLARCPRADFVIVGAGALREAHEAQARDLGIADRVTFTGARPDAIEILKTFDLFVSPSRYEGLPTVVLEAIAAGLPVVATRVSGNSELIEDGVSGLLAPPEDPRGLADALVTIAAGQARAAEMAALAYDRTKRLYSMDAVAARHTELYCALAGRPGSRAAG